MAYWEYNWKNHDKVLQTAGWIKGGGRFFISPPLAADRGSSYSDYLQCAVFLSEPADLAGKHRVSRAGGSTRSWQVPTVPWAWHCPLCCGNAEFAVFYSLCILSPLKAQMFFPQSVPTSPLSIYGLGDQRDSLGMVWCSSPGTCSQVQEGHFASLRSFQILSRTKGLVRLSACVYPPSQFQLPKCLYNSKIDFSPAKLPTTRWILFFAQPLTNKETTSLLQDKSPSKRWAVRKNVALCTISWALKLPFIFKYFADQPAPGVLTVPFNHTELVSEGVLGLLCHPNPGWHCKAKEAAFSTSIFPPGHVSLARALTVVWHLLWWVKAWAVLPGTETRP